MYSLLIITLICEFCAALAATIYFSKYKNSQLWLLLPLLWYIIINEILCQFVFQSTTTGYILYNLYQVVVSITLLLITYNQIQDRKRKKIIAIFTIICALGFIVNAFIINPFEERFSSSSLLSAVLIVLGLLYYLIELLKSDKVINIGRDLFIWIAIGFLIFFLAYPVLSFARKFLVSDNLNLLKSLNYVHFIVAIISYIVITFGFYYGEKRQTII